MEQRRKLPSRWRSLVALVIAATAATLALGVGTAGAQAITLAEPGTLGAETTNNFCYNFQTTGASSPANLSYAVTTGTLPTGLGISSYTFGAAPGLTETRWAIGGAPSTPGTSAFVVTVTDNMGTPGVGDDLTDTANFTIDVAAEAATDIVIAAGRLSAGYTIDCTSQGREVQGALRDFDNFGTGGTDTNRLAIRNHTLYTGGGNPIDAAYLAGVDILLDGWVWDGEWQGGELPLIQDWVNNGGVLIANEDRAVADQLGAMFGAPTGGFRTCTHTPAEIGDPVAVCPEFDSANAGHAIVAGPFGDWDGTPLHTSGSVGRYDTDPAGWTVVVRDDLGRATVIERAVGNGHVILTTDEGLWRTQSYGAGFANDVFVKNVIAYAIAQIGGGSAGPDLTDDYIQLPGATALGANNVCGNDTSTGPIVFAPWSPALPTGVTFNPATCRVSGTVNESFTFYYQGTVGGVDGSAAVTVDITPNLANDTFTGRVGDAFEGRMCQNDPSLGDVPRTTTIVSGTLPAGITRSGCTLSGTPTEAGVFTITYQVADGHAQADTATVTLTIAELGAPDPDPEPKVFRCKGEIATIVGTMGDDVLKGTPGRDVIVGRGGNDVIRGRGGDDLICAGRGDDVIRGNSGNDNLYGQGGADIVKGGKGADSMIGGKGADRLAGNGGRPDVCTGGPGRDTILNGCEHRRP